MRILALVHQYVPERCAGAETHIHAMLRALARRGHHIDVSLSHQSGDPYVLDGVHVWPAVDPRRDVFGWLPGADVLVAHLQNTTRATVLGELNQIPVVVVQHNTFDQSMEALTLASARVDLVATNSEWMDADLADWFWERKTPQPRTVVVRPVVDPAEYATEPGDQVTLINLRRSSPGANADALTKGGELFHQIAARMPKTRFLGVTGAYGVQQDMADLDNVEVIDHVAHTRMRDEVYGRTRVLLVPSSYESWGRVAAEAMCSGIPVIAHPTPGLTECLGDAGIFVDRDDLDGWIRALSTLAMPNSWTAASRRSLDRAAELAAGDDLTRWCQAIERTAPNGIPIPRLHTGGIVNPNNAPLVSEATISGCVIPLQQASNQ